MKNSTSKTNATIYRPECIEGRWYAKNLSTGEISDTLSFQLEMLSEMHCANLMGLRTNEAKSLWSMLDDEAVRYDLAV